MADTTTGDQIKQLTEQINALVGVVSTLAKNQAQFQNSGNTETSTTTTNDTKIFDSICARIPMFVYDAEEEKTFDNWYTRYEEVIIKDGASLAEDLKTRIVLSKLGQKDYALYTNRCLPKLPNEISYTDTIKNLKALFKSTTSIFRKRQEFLRTEFGGGSLEEYTGTVLRRFATSEFKKMTDEQTCAMVWIAGMRDPSYQDIRARALQVLEQKPNLTLLELESDVKRLLDIRADARAVGGSVAATSDVNAVQKFQKSKKNTPEKKDSKQPPSACYRCGGNHWVRDCEHKKVTCSYCKKPGHLEKCCRNKNRENKSPKVKTVYIGAASIDGAERIYRQVQINGHCVKMLLDTGADITLLSQNDWTALGRPKLEKPTIKVKSATHEPVKIFGSLHCKYMMNGRQESGVAFVSNTDTLLGRDWISKDKELWKFLQNSEKINRVSVTEPACNYLGGTRERLIEAIGTKYKEIMKPGLGKCTKTKATLTLKPNARPIFRKARPVTYSARPMVSAEIERLNQTGVISPVDHSEWAAPVVAVKKKNGSIRLCADFSTGLNDAIESNNHPLPTSDDIFAKLNGGNFFTQIDLAEAYLQVEMDPDSQKLLVINTHLGLFTYNRLPFGVKSAPGIFQQIMDTMLNGLEGVSTYLDDIIICGSTIEEHNERVFKVFGRIQEYGFRIKMEKCSFLMEEIKFLGFIINKQGRRPDPEKVLHIKNMPEPTNVSQVKSFLGLIQFYGQFVKQLFRLRQPLDNLTAKDTDFKWTLECQKSFDTIKEILQSDLLLTHYNPNLPIIVAADASQYGIGATISHRFPDGTEKTIYHISKTLSKTQRNYSQIEKEGFGLITAVTKFHKFIHGRKFTLRTDHKPLLTIFGGKKGVPVYTANRLQRWATILLNYDFDIEYINTKDFGQVDALSRLIDEQNAEKAPEDFVIAQVELDPVDQLSQNLSFLPITAKTISFQTGKDTLLTDVLNSLKSGKWPKSEKGTEMWNMCNRKDEFSIVNDCIVLGERVVIPTVLRQKVLKTLHRAHPGIVRMKMLARSYVYWPGIDKDIEKVVKSCDECASAAKNPVKNLLYSWPIPKKPFERVHVDFAGPVDGMYYLVFVDSFSKWPEVYATTSTTTAATIKILAKVFGQFGNPETLVSDNGPQFTSQTFQEFTAANGITHVRSPPYHPQSNGQAERFVDTLKRALCKLRGEGNTETALQTFLQVYRSTPCPSVPNNQSPAEAFIGRKMRTVLNLLLPHKPTPSLERNLAMETQFNLHHGARDRIFEINDQVYVIDRRSPNSSQWVSGVIERKLGQTVYKVRVGSQRWTRHANQLRQRTSPPSHYDWSDFLEIEDPAEEMPKSDRADDTTIPVPSPRTSIPPTTPVPLRRSTRTIKPVQPFQIQPKQKRY
ncbi:hypothetical protein CRE_11440 [Caenorhabditis remanei]|uniref:RNA-directed DNA polymerase n=1 Tax=Caenorhabditis remanei TaxID=31234 RepID=E3NBH2_CAERE|nr:hypothetical protein CRE_11440 [Caenorhabditis remanei]